MNDEQLALIIKALTDGFARVAAAIETARESSADETIQFALGDYKSFDWSSIGATVVQHDADGVSMIRAANGKLAKRRSNDKFGTEIWFSYADGKDERGENKYVKVIEFRTIAAPEPLGRKTEQALNKSAPTQTPAPAAPAQKQASPASPPPAPAHDMNDVRVQWGVAMRAARAAGANPPPALDLEASNTDGQIRHKTLSLICVALCAQAQRDMAGTASEHFVAQCQAARIAYDDALSAGAEVPGTMALTLDDTLTTIEAKLSTLSNLRDAARRAAGQRAAATTKAPEASPADVVIDRLNAAARRNANRSMTKAQDGLTVRALEALCGNEQLRHAFTRAVFGKSSYADLQVSQRLALFDWLKPAEQNGAAGTTNANASASAAAVLATAAQPEAV